MMVDQLGRERYLEESGARVIHRDEFGVLYERLSANDRLMLVLVNNPTPERDGRHKQALLPVDPGAYGGVRTARAAVASTWRRNGQLVFNTPAEYHPDFSS